MLRIANPGSDISSFIRIFIELYEALGNRATFGLDDMSRTLVDRNLATSSGFMGEEALARSTREDRSRDPLYNQSKMYSELYKILGWLHPLPESALTFRFTYLGAHVVEAKRDPKLLMKECILGIVYPNSIIKINGNYVLRPFATILNTMAKLGGLLCRDEMILGPLCLEDDRDSQKVTYMIEQIQSLRGNWPKLQGSLASLSASRQISQTTMENYTRFPLAVMKWTGWATSERQRDIYGKPVVFLELTNDGWAAAEAILQSIDIRSSDLTNLDNKSKEAIVRLGFYSMLDRSGFEIDTLNDQISDYQRQLEGEIRLERPIIFSPFQELDPEYTSRLFPSHSSTIDVTDQVMLPAIETNRDHLKDIYQPSSHRVFKLRANLSVHDALANKASVFDGLEKSVADLFQDLFNTDDVGTNVESMANSLAGVNKDVFYPLVASLFRVLGYNCQHSRAGVNYERWDAFIIDTEQSIPIEIKSPGEESFISVKAVRQALENKVILMARRPFPTRPETTTLVVGYNLPNDRSEVLSLISDIYKAYSIKIGVIDIRSLLWLVVATLFGGKKHDSSKLINLYGIIDVSDF